MRFQEYLATDPRGQTVLLRGDVNVPCADGQIQDDVRIRTLMTAIDALVQAGTKVVIVSHFGRPKGQVRPQDSLHPICRHLAHLRQRPVTFVPDPFTDAGRKVLAAMVDGDVAMIENMRFWPGEEAHDPAFARVLAGLGQVFVNDAFSASHRDHASITGVAAHLPAVSGPALEAEIAAISRICHAPRRPVMAIVGGAKISTKLAVLQNLVTQVDCLAIGGAMANNFLRAQGHETGRSLIEPAMIPLAADIITRAGRHGCRLWLPGEVHISKALVPDAAVTSIASTAIPPESIIGDISPRAAQELCRLAADCRTIMWNGPLGAFEIPPFDTGTRIVADALAAGCRAGTYYAVIGGGDTLAAVGQERARAFSYASTAGGAFLEYLEGKPLPGLSALGLA